jgi:hypothetical protein
LGDAFAQLLLPAEPVLTAQFEQLAFAGERVFDIGIVEMAGKLRRHRHGIGAVALGGKPRLARIKLGEALGDDGEVCAGHRLVEPQKNVAGFHVVAIANEQFPDHAAGRMLDFFHVRIDDDRTRRDERPRDLRGRRPAAQAEHQRGDEDGAGKDMPSDR